MVLYFIKKREIIYIVLLFLAMTSFCFSYAINSISMFLLIGFFFLDTKKKIREKLLCIRRNKLVALYVLFFLTQIIGLIYTDNLDFGIRKVKLLIPCVFIPSVVLTEKVSEYNYNLLFNALKWTVVLIFIGYLSTHLFLDKRSVETFVHFTVQQKIGISQFYLSFIFLIGLYECSRKIFIKKKNKKINTILFFYFFCLLGLMGNRTILFLTILFLIIYVVCKWKKGNFRTKLGVMTFALLLGLSLCQIDIIGKKIDIFLKTTDFNLETIKTKNRFTITKNTFEHRVLINYLAFQRILNTLPLGVGTGDYKDVIIESYKGIGFKAGIENRYNLHNQYFSEFLKTGLLGGSVFLAIIFCLLKNLNWNQEFYVYLTLTFCMSCFVESYLERQHGVFIFALLLPFFMKYDNNTSI